PGQHALDDRMAASFEGDREAVIDLRPDIGVVMRQVGERAPHVEPGERAGRRLHPGDGVPHAGAQRVHELSLALRDPFLGTEDLGLVGLELGRHEPLRPGEGLAAFVIRGYPIAMSVRDLEVVAEHLVEPDLQRGDTRTLALPRLEPGDVLLPAIAGILEVVELSIVPTSDCVAVWVLERRLGHQRDRRPCPAALYAIATVLC